MATEKENQFDVLVAYKKLVVWGVVTPFGWRKKNTFRIGDAYVLLDFERKEILERRNGSNVVLASMDLKRGRRWSSHHEGWVGRVVLPGHEMVSIELALDELDGVRCSVITAGGHQCVFRVLHEPKLFVKLDELEIRVDQPRYYWNPEETNRVEIRCSNRQLNVAKVLGVLICSLLFDCLLNPGMHS